MCLPFLFRVMLAVSVLFGCLPHFAAGQEDSEVSIRSNPAGTETVYRIVSGSCQIDWTLIHSGLNAGIVLHREVCGLPLRQQVPLITKLLEKVVSADGDARSFRTLSLGRLHSFPEMPERLAILAARSPQWDRRAGRPKSGSSNTFIAELAKHDSFYQEWQTMFARFDRHVEISGVEKVLVSEAGKLPFFTQLQAHDVTATDKLPYDCVVWLSVKPRTPGGRN